MRRKNVKAAHKHARVVVMDRDRETAGQLLKELRDLGYSVEGIEQTKILLQKVRNDLIDVLILAVDAWGGGRFELIPVVKKLNRSLPIIAISSDDSLETAAKVREQGVFFYALKPLDIREIDIAVKNALARTPTWQRPITVIEQTQMGKELEHEILDIEAAGKVLNLSRNVLSRLAKQGEIPACKIASRWYFVRNQVYEWMRLRAAANECDYNRLILETMDEGVAVVDRKLKIISCNSAYLKALDVPRDQVVGEPCYRVSHRSVVPCDEPICPVRKAFKTQQAVKALHINYDSEGKERYCEVVALPIKDKRGDVNSVLEIIRDNTEMYILNRHLSSVMRFFARETKATLGAVMMNISALADDTLSKTIGPLKQREMLASSLCSLKLMHDMIRNYIISYQVENGRLRCSKDKVNVADGIINPVITETAPLLGKRKISVDTNISGAISTCCDIELVKVALTNMIICAAKYAKSGSNISCSGEIESGRVVIMVSGVGDGVPHEKFHVSSEGGLDIEQWDMSEAEMGIHIARRIAELHGGIFSIDTGYLVEERHVSFEEFRRSEQYCHLSRANGREFVTFQLRIPHADVYWEDGGDK
jgi:PAS domain S-box-containing protein